MDQLPHHKSSDRVLESLGSSVQGLSVSEAQKRLEKYGPNKLPEDKRLRVVALFFSQFTNMMVILMGVAAILSFLFGHTFDAALISGMVLVSVIMGFFQEFRAEKSVSALKGLLVARVVVRRDGKIMEIPQDEVTIGDIVQLQEGNQVPSDGRIFSSHNCLVTESALTGESVPVEKDDTVLPTDTPLAERVNMLWMGTTVVQGTADMVVTAIGLQTEFGKIAEDLKSVETEREHFSEKISILSKQMGTIAVISATATFVVGYIIRGFSLPEISIYTIATLVSALPEGLPTILVIVLSVGAQRMAKKNAIVRKLSATETLGVVSVIITDKTGTLTQNVMSARRLYLPGQDFVDIKDDETSKTVFYQQDEPLLLHEDTHLRKLVSIAGTSHQVKAMDESQKPSFHTLFGDPTEKALFLLSHKAGFDHLADEHKPVLIDDIPFQQQLRMRASLIEIDGQREVFVMGAPEKILEQSSKVLVKEKITSLAPSIRKEIEEKIEKLSNEGLRVVAVGSKPAPQRDSLALDDLEVSGVFVGLIGIYDPPRPEVKLALEEAREAGIKIIMATGDHPRTALAIAKEIGLITDSSSNAVLTQSDLEDKSDAEILKILKETHVLARLTPQMKLKVAELIQSQDKVIAMTGDGVNDAPALKKADVGIAMGISGTDVAKEASKIVLADDNFASIVAAIKEGRTQFNNLRRTCVFLIMTNISESMSLLVALMVGLPLPLLPIQILWLNVITGGLTDFALSLEPSHSDSMKYPPRSPKENILNKDVIPLILTVTSMTIVLCLGAFYFFLPQGVDSARTALFVVLSSSQLLNMFNLRSLKKPALQMGLSSNRPIVVVLFISLGFLFAALFFAPLQKALGFSPLLLSELVVLMVVSMLIFISAEITKSLTKNHIFKRRLQAA